MGDFIDISGQKFGKLTAVKYAGFIKNRGMWECVCDCGEKRIVNGVDLRGGNSASCGCVRVERIRNLNLTHGQQRMGNRTPEHRAWRHMKSRCLNPNVHNYDKYGGRGIKVCGRWVDSFQNFFEDMGVRPSSKHSLDRVNVNGDYEPSNCRWATTTEQSYNKRTTVRYEYGGRLFILPDLLNELSVTKGAFGSYCYRNSVQEAINFYHNKKLKQKT